MQKTLVRFLLQRLNGSRMHQATAAGYRESLPEIKFGSTGSPPVSRYSTYSQKDLLRSPLWRGKKSLSIEAQQAVTFLKAAKGSPRKVEEVLSKKISRLIKVDHLSVLYELQQENEADLAFKVFEQARKEIWYKPDVPLYRDMLKAFARSAKVEEVDRLLEQMKEEKVELEMIVFVEVIEIFIHLGMCDPAMKFFKQMKASEAPPNVQVYRRIINCLNMGEHFELSSKLQKELALFIKFRFGNDSYPPCRAQRTNQGAPQTRK